MADRWMAELVERIRQGQPGEVAGSRVALDLVLAEDLLNRALAERLPPGGAVQHLRITVAPDRARVTLRLARPSFLPPFNVGVTIAAQPTLPDGARLVLRLGMPPGLGMLAGFGASLFNALPPGVRLEGDRVTVDLERLLIEQDLGWVLRYGRSLLVTFEAGRVRLQASAALE